jgi:predicted metal-dependent peptidase
MITEKQFDSILVKFLIDEPFFATIIRGMRKICDPKIGTAGVTYKDGTMTLYWSPEFVSSLSREKIFGLLKHECYHLIFKHVTTRKREPHNYWNIATDLAINSIIPRAQLPECGLIPGVKNKLEVKEGIEIDPARRAMIEKMNDWIASLPGYMSSEWYMEKILENKSIQETIDGLQDVIIVLDEHDNSELSETDKIIADQKVKEILEKAKEVGNSRSWGSVSMSVRAEVEKLTTVEFKWERALKYFCGSKLRNNYFKTQRKINRKYPYIHAGRKTEKTSMLAVYIDQSGSVGPDSLARFGKILEQLSKTHTFVYYYFDSQVDEESKTTWKKGKRATFGRGLSGGTCFNAVEDHFRKISKNFDGCIVMTDGYAAKPKTCTTKRCWVICPSGKLQFEPDKRDYVISMSTGI